MVWSKLKARIEAGFAAPVRGRVALRATRYRRAHDEAGEAWITLDGERIASFADLTFLVESSRRRAELCAEGLEGGSLYSAAERDVAARGVAALWDVKVALADYLNLSIDAILASESRVIRALGMLDQRLGKRRLRGMDVSADLPMVQAFHAIRCRLERIAPQPAKAAASGTPA
jgi:hypothetical protein